MSILQAPTNRFLTSLSKADYALLAPSLKSCVLEQGTLLYEPDEEITRVYFPQTGLISRFRVMEDGQAIETSTVGNEGAIGISAGVGFPFAHSRAEVQLRMTGMQISAVSFRISVQESTAIRNLIMKFSELILFQTQTTAACNALHSVEARLCRWILHASDRAESSSLPLTQELLSQILGVRRASVNEVANKLLAAGAIEHGRGVVTIIDRDRLKAMSCECYRTQLAESEKMFKRH